ncbi:MAG TPA: SBBP repeat-containing protein [Bacteroidia bacterium]|nr:SBBP repeat-containing protein [Bacteroidia bacterium]
MKAKIQLQKWIVAYLLLISYCSNAQTLDWANQIGGADYDISFDMTIDNNGNTYAVGYFTDSVDFDPGPDTLVFQTPGIAGDADAFVMKTDSLGDLVWVKIISSINSETSNTITIDNLGYIYVSGNFEGTVNFDFGQSNFSITAFGNNDVFILKLDINGNFIWAKQIGGITDESSRDIKILGDKLYLTGTFTSTVDFDLGVGTFNLTSVAGRDAFVCKLDTGGNLIWAKQLGGAGTYQDGNALAIDTLGNVYVTGRFNGTIDLDPGAGVFNVSTPTGNTLDMDAFICKLNTVGDFVWGMKLGSNLGDESYKIILDVLGNVYACGVFYNTIDFDPGTGVFNMTSAGGADFFMLKLDSDGNFGWAKRLGNTNNDFGIISTDAYGSLYICGAFIGTFDSDPGASVFSLTSTGAFNSNGFISKLDAQGNFLWAIKFDGNYSNGIIDMSFGTSNNIYIHGGFMGTMDCDPGTGVYNFTSNGSRDMFFMRLSQPMVGVVNQQATAAGGITVYPNPTQGITTVALQKIQKSLTVKIYNSTGQLLQTGDGSNTNTLQITLPYKTGVYFAEVIMDDGVRMVKMVRE